jgi:Protein of unknown function with HXXEE motif
MNTSPVDNLNVAASESFDHDYILWVLVAFSALHMVEEYAFDWPGWLRSVGISCADTDMFVMNLAFFGIGVCASLGGWRVPSFSLSYAALVLINAAFHIIVSLIYWRLNPGTLTAVVLFLPLGTLCFVYAHRDGVLTRMRLAGAFVIGLFIHAFPVFVLLTRRSLSY